MNQSLLWLLRIMHTQREINLSSITYPGSVSKSKADWARGSSLQINEFVVELEIYPGFWSLSVYQLLNHGLGLGHVKFALQTMIYLLPSTLRVAVVQPSLTGWWCPGVVIVSSIILYHNWIEMALACFRMHWRLSYAVSYWVSLNYIDLYNLYVYFCWRWQEAET